MNNTKCPNCGAAMKEWKHTLTPGLVSILIKAVRAVHNKNKNEFHLQRDLSLSKNEYNNAQKLRFFGLIAKGDKKGWWVITRKGGEFLRGEISVDKSVSTFRNHITKHSEEQVHRRDFYGKGDWLESDFDFTIREGLVVPLSKEPAKLFN